MDTGGKKCSGNGGEVIEGQPHEASSEGDHHGTIGVSSQGREVEIPRVCRLSEPTAIFGAGYFAITHKPSSYCLENNQDDIAQDNYQFSSSKVCSEEVLCRDDALFPFPSRHDANPPRQFDNCKYSGSSLMARGDQKPHGRTTIVNQSCVNNDQFCPKLSWSLDTAPAMHGNFGAELVKDVDWHSRRTDSIESEVQSTLEGISLGKRSPSHGKPALTPALKLEPQNSRRSLDETPHTYSTKQVTKTYNKRINGLQAVEEETDKVSALSDYSHWVPRAVPSSSPRSTESAAPDILSTLIDNITSHLEIGDWAADENSSGPKPLFPDCLDALPSPFNDEWESALTQRGSESDRSTEQSEYRPSRKASKTDQNRRPAKRKRFYGGGGNGEGANDENDENDDGEDSTRRTPDKSFPEYTKKELLACPFYKNDPAYFAADLFHDGKYLICAKRGFPDIARLKEHIYRKHSLPFTCSRCGDIFKSKLALDAHLPVRNPEKITCEVRTLPPSATKGLTPDMERELRNRSKNGATPTMEAVWIDMYQKLFPGTHVPSSGPYLTNSRGPSWGIEEREEYIRFSERLLPRLVKETLGAALKMPPQDRDLIISIVKSCQRKIPGMFLQGRETSKARLASKDRSLRSISESSETSETPTETMIFSSPSAHHSFQSDYGNVFYGSKEPPIPTSQFDKISPPPDIRFMGHIPSIDSWHDSSYETSSRSSKSIYSVSDYLPNQGSSSCSTLDDSGRSMMFPPLSGQDFVEPMAKTVDYSATEFSVTWPHVPLTAGYDLERTPSGANSESTAANINSGSVAMPQTGTQIYYHYGSSAMPQTGNEFDYFDLFD